MQDRESSVNRHRRDAWVSQQIEDEDRRRRRASATRVAIVGSVVGAIAGAVGNTLVEVLKWLFMSGRPPHS